MGGIGIVNNPRSRRNRSDPRIAGRLRAMLGDDGEVMDASTPGELARAVARFRAAEIDVLGVNGGDGTAHLVLTAFVRAYGRAPLPRLLLLRGGSMNTVSHGHGIRGRPERILREVLVQKRRGAPLRTIERDLLAVSADGAPPSYGFIFGTGAVVAFLEAYYATGRTSPTTAAALIVRAIASAIAGGPFAEALTRRQRLRVVTDGDEWPDVPYLALVAGATPDIGFGFKAFARCAEQPGSFHAVGLTAGLLPLALALPRIHRGAPWRRTLAQDEVARELVAEGNGIRFTIDGDLYAARAEVRVTTGPGITLVLP
jgi:diacylglycerol kinase family enzyme